MPLFPLRGPQVQDQCRRGVPLPRLQRQVVDCQPQAPRNPMLWRGGCSKHDRRQGWDCTKCFNLLAFRSSRPRTGPVLPPNTHQPWSTVSVQLLQFWESDITPGFISQRSPYQVDHWEPPTHYHCQRPRTPRALDRWTPSYQDPFPWHNLTRHQGFLRQVPWTSCQAAPGMPMLSLCAYLILTLPGTPWTLTLRNWCLDISKSLGIRRLDCSFRVRRCHDGIPSRHHWGPGVAHWNHARKCVSGHAQAFWPWK